jgi:hypothetical protein
MVDRSFSDFSKMMMHLAVDICRLNYMIMYNIYNNIYKLLYYFKLSIK